MHDPLSASQELDAFIDVEQFNCLLPSAPSQSTLDYPKTSIKIYAGWCLSENHNRNRWGVDQAVWRHLLPTAPRVNGARSIDFLLMHPGGHGCPPDILQDKYDLSQLDVSNSAMLENLASMASLRDLPVELLSLVFGFIYSSCRRLPSYDFHSVCWSDLEKEAITKSEEPITKEKPTTKEFEPIDPEDMLWDEKDDPRSTSLFPYNVVWWSRIVFDVANDTLPLLDAFLWSKTLRISVLVFSSANDATEDHKSQEHRRTSYIISRLRPHIERCTSIVCDVQYVSSLPSPTIVFTREAHHLQELMLECHVDDLRYDLDDRSTTDIETTSAETNFPALRRISLHGLAFMELWTLGRDWTSELKMHDDSFAVTISHFQFQKDRDGVDHGNTFTNFMDLLMPIRFMTSTRFKNFSLSYRLRRKKLESRHNLDSSALYFDNVSSQFIAEFYRTVECSPESIQFSHCSIPQLSRGYDCWFLTLEHISGTTNTIDDGSLYNILSVWDGSALSVVSCAFFEIACLDASTRRGQVSHFCAYVSVRDCTNFTTDAMLRLVDARTDQSRADPDVDPEERFNSQGGWKTTCPTERTNQMVPQKREQGHCWLVHRGC
ncbi:hypothetical protein BDZ97DRAFT_1762642 [Flammula alnicola]|nr:hypothetical protein BDZ97DRAFT_1762642 [Flammula alnicola]